MSSQIKNSTAEVAVIGSIAFEARQDLPVYSQRMKRGYRIEGNGKVPGFAAIGVFLFFGATMAGLAATTLLWPGTRLDRAWGLNPTAYQQLAPFGGKIGILFLFLAAALVTSALGLEVGRRNPRDTSSWRPHQPREGRLVARGNWRCHRRCPVALPPIGASQRCVF